MCTLACNLDHGGGSGRLHATTSGTRWGGSPCKGWVCAPQNSQSAPSQCSFFLAPSRQPDAGPTVQPAAPPGGALWGCLPGHLPGHFNLTVHLKARGLWHLNCMFACRASFFPSQGARCGHFDVTSNFHLPWRSSACHPLPVSVPCMSLMPLLQRAWSSMHSLT